MAIRGSGNPLLICPLCIQLNSRNITEGKGGVIYMFEEKGEAIKYSSGRKIELV